MSDRNISGVSRRSFMRVLGAASVAATSIPAFARQSAAGLTQPTPTPGRGMADMGEMRVLPPDTVIISSNENPLGPAKCALESISSTASMGGRYHHEIQVKAVQAFNDSFGLPKGYTVLTPGSGGILDMALQANIGPDRPLVFGDPSYEQGPRSADAMKAPKFPVKLTASGAHDVKAMLAAHPSPGAYYIVNPNNPTGTMTPHADIAWLLENKPKGSVVIVDEAYFHFSPDESVIPLTMKHDDLIVTRTFSKIYGMAGLRAGVAIANPATLNRFSIVNPAGRSAASISITSAAAAMASIQDKDLVGLRRKINADIREETVAFLTKKSYKVLPGSQANFFMVDTGRPGREFQVAMLKDQVAVGRTWAALPTYVRVTVGTKPEMQKFQEAFVKCMDMKPSSTSAFLHMPELDHIPTELYRG